MRGEDAVDWLVLCGVLAFFLYQPLDESGTRLTVAFFAAMALHLIR